MNVRAKSLLSLLPLSLCLAAPLGAQDRPLSKKPLATYAVDADKVMFQVDPANGCVIVLVAWSDRLCKPAPGLPWLLAKGEVYTVLCGKPAGDPIAAITLSALLGLRYHVQLVTFDGPDATVRASQPVAVAWAEGDERARPAHARKVLPMQPLDDAAVAEPNEGDKKAMDAQPSIDELAGQMKFWIDRQKGASYAKLRADFRTSNGGYAWSSESTSRETDGSTDVFLVLATPTSPAYLLVEEHLQTSVPIPNRDGTVRIFLGLQRDDGTEPDFVLIREL